MAQTKKEEVQPKKKERQFVLKEKKVDAFTTLRTRVLLTPCVCPKCAFDLCEKNELGDYDQLDEAEKARVAKAMAKHSEFHTTAENRVVDESEIPTSNLRSPRLVG